MTTLTYPGHRNVVRAIQLSQEERHCPRHYNTLLYSHPYEVPIHYPPYPTAQTLALIHY